MTVKFAPTVNFSNQSSITVFNLLIILYTVQGSILICVVLSTRVPVVGVRGCVCGREAGCLRKCK